jgi:DNA polymerase III sliding clamp (beta) subunit (PCNA family)
MKGMDFYAEMNVGDLRRALAFVVTEDPRLTQVIMPMRV